MNTKIALLGNSDFIELVKGLLPYDKIDATIDVTIELYQCYMEGCLNLLPTLEENGTDVIITGHANRKLLLEKTTIPIIPFHISTFDILSSIKKAAKITTNIGIVLANFEIFDFDYSALNDLLNLNLQFITYENSKELHQKISMLSNKMDVVIGTSVAVNVAKEHDLDGILIYSLENTINETLKKALDFLSLQRNKEYISKQFHAIINSVNEGIIATDSDGKITMVNDQVQKMLNLSKQKVEGTKLFDILPELNQNEVIINDYLLIFDNSKISVNQEPLYIKGINTGNIYTFHDVTEIQKIEQKYRSKLEAKGFFAKASFENIIYRSKIMKKTIEKAKKYAKTESTILIIGETGTGKELFAQSIHNCSNRRNSPFVAVNCAALPENLLESELFGYDTGAFTGASSKGKKGLFEIAHNGTIFLDEINSVSLAFQTKLLRVLQEKEVIRIGSNKVLPINIRVIAASNEELISLVEAGKFRADLFYRLNVLRINIPPLRERMEDIVPIASRFLLNHNPILYQLVEPYLEKLCGLLENNYFIGNVRELFNIFERFTVLCDPNLSNFEDFKKVFQECCEENSIEYALKQDMNQVHISLKNNFKDSMTEAEKAILLRYLEMANHDKPSIAKKLGIGKTTLYRKLKELKIDV